MSNQLVILVKLPLKGHNHLVLIVGIVLVFFFFSFKNVFTFFSALFGRFNFFTCIILIFKLKF